MHALGAYPACPELLPTGWLSGTAVVLTGFQTLLIVLSSKGKNQHWLRGPPPPM